MTNKNRKPEPVDPEAFRLRLEPLIKNFEAELLSGELRSKVLALIPIFQIFLA